MHCGTLQGDLLLFGGCYSNLQATEAMRALAETRGIPKERIFCTGDTVAYCGQPEETVSLIREWGIPVLMGNCEESLGEDSDDCGCGFEAGSSCALLSDDWFSFARRKLSATNAAWMRTLPRTIEFVWCNKHVLLTHGAPSQINRFVFGSTPDQVIADEFAHTQADTIIGGHSGIPFGRTLGSHTWLNTGAIGMPANDGCQHTWYLLLRAGDTPSAHWHRLDYDTKAAQDAMRTAQLNTPYCDSLLSGRWPSMSVLPAPERARCGQPIAPFCMDW